MIHISGDRWHLRAKSKAFIGLIALLKTECEQFYNCCGGISLKIENMLKNEKKRNLSYCCLQDPSEREYARGEGVVKFKYSALG